MKEQEIHSSNIEKEWNKLVQKDIDKFITPYKDTFISIEKCPSCNSKLLKFEFQHQGLDYNSCEECNLLFLNPFPNEELKTSYIIKSKALEMWRINIPEIKTRIKMYEDRADFIQPYLFEYFENKGSKLKLMEIGAGNGELIEILLNRYDNIIEEIIVIEPQILNINSSKLKFISGIFNKDHSLNLTNSIDMVIAFEVLEHILYPNDFFNNINNSLKKEGLFLISTPNAFSLETLINQTQSRNIGFDHVRLFNPKSIQILAQNNNFKSLKINTPGKLDAEILINSNFFSNTELIEDVVKQTNAQWIYDYIEAIRNNSITISQFQDKIIQSQLSGHMKCVFQKMK